MFLFHKTRYYVDVCFAGGARPYTYISTNERLEVGQIVHVPMVSGSKLSKVVAIRPCDSTNAKLLRVGRKATDAETTAFRKADRQRPQVVFAPNPVPASLAALSNRGFCLLAVSLQKGI